MDLNSELSALQTTNEFQKRHIGPSNIEQLDMLKELGFQNLEEGRCELLIV